MSSLGGIPVQQAVPQPEVTHDGSSYKDVSESSYKGRTVDDFLPRKNIDQLSLVADNTGAPSYFTSPSLNLTLHSE